ncbi:MAG: transketolase [Chloroflexi bacterium RBG_13_54_9]|nr:MAG: transketolase [Chloroflexi bacterium RBG_13_54_9]
MFDDDRLPKQARWLRQQILEMCVRAGEGRLASSLSWVEVAVALYYGGILRFDPANPQWEERDRFVLSKGQGVVALYPILADLGFFSKAELDKFCQPAGMLGPYGHDIPGVEALWGSVGHGLGVAAGLALAAKMDRKLYMTVVLLGDGECYEGSTWEAAMFAGHHELNNLVAVVDRNWLCTIDFTENCLRLNPLDDKWRAFGWDVTTIDGHCFEEIFAAFENFRSRRSNKPLVVIANTVKGKGLSFLEYNPMAHIIIPSGEQLERAREELECPL